MNEREYKLFTMLDILSKNKKIKKDKFYITADNIKIRNKIIKLKFSFNLFRNVKYSNFYIFREFFDYYLFDIHKYKKFLVIHKEYEIKKLRDSVIKMLYIITFHEINILNKIKLIIKIKLAKIIVLYYNIKIATKYVFKHNKKISLWYKIILIKNLIKNYC